MNEDTKIAGHDSSEHSDGCSCGHEHCHTTDSDSAGTEKSSWFSRLGVGWLRFGGAWVGISALWSTTTVCPICGSPVCGFNLTLAVLVGFFGSLLFFIIRNWGKWIGKLKSSVQTHTDSGIRK